MPIMLVAAVCLIPFIFAILTYNSLVSLRNHIRESWSNIDTELKRRYDLIPNLVATVKGYAAHEKEILQRVTELRARCVANTGTPGVQAVDEVELVSAIQKMLIVVERYPDLKADRHFLELQKELVNTEDRIQAARRFYNGNVRDYQNRCETFPSSLVAGAFGFAPEELFNVPPAVREVPDVSRIS